MDLADKKSEIEKKVEEINEKRKALFEQLELTGQEFLKLQGEFRLIEELLVNKPGQQET